MNVPTRSQGTPTGWNLPTGSQGTPTGWRALCKRVTNFRFQTRPCFKTCPNLESMAGSGAMSH